MPKLSASPHDDVKGQESLTVNQQIQLLKEQLELQNQQMQSVVGQIQVLKDKLAAETSARLEAQVIILPCVC